MVSRTTKSLGLPPIFGLPPGLAIGLGVGLIAVGVVSAVTLDSWSRSSSPVVARLADNQPISTDVFEAPDSGIARSASFDQNLPWVKHAAPYPAGDRAPRLAIIVVDDGTDAGAALTAMRMRAPLTLAIAPTADSADKRAAAARRFGREVLLLLPMEAETSFDTTPNPIGINVPRDELLRRIDWNLAQIDGYVGVMNQFGEATTRDANTMRTVMEVLQAEGLSFIDSRAHKDSVGSAVARRLGVPTGDRVIAISKDADAADLGAALASATTHAEKWGTAIITIPADRKVIAALQKWIDEPRQTVKLAPVTAVIKRLRSGRS